MEGQMSLFDFLPDQAKKPDKWSAALPKDRKKKQCGDDNIPCAWKPEFAPCETCKRETVPKGKRLTCRTCSHMWQSVCGSGDIYHGFACFGFGIAKSEDIRKEACGDYEEATDGEAWRTSDAAVKEWLGYEW